MNKWLKDPKTMMKEAQDTQNGRKDEVGSSADIMTNSACDSAQATTNSNPSAMSK